MKKILTIALILFSTGAAAQLIIPYDRSPYVQTLPQMQREWEREREAKKLIDYQVEQQHEADRRLERDREFNRQLDRLHRGY